MNKPLSNTMNYNEIIFNKVPQITIFFWIVKILTTGMGEVFSDFLLKTITPPIIAVALGLIGLIAALIVQLSMRRYVAWIYWLTVIMVSIFGTMFSDILHVVVGLPYPVSSIIFIVTAIAIFSAWYVSEKTLSIHSIYTNRRETFYWAAVLITFAMGTSVGDLTAKNFQWGYFPSGVIFTVMFIIPILAYKFFGLNEIITFWLSYVMTRPLGASFADWMGTPTSNGGLGFGTGQVSLGLTIIIIGILRYLSVTHKDVKSENMALADK